MRQFATFSLLLNLSASACGLVRSRGWSRRGDLLAVVKPDMVVRWHPAGFGWLRRWQTRSHGPVRGSSKPKSDCNWLGVMENSVSGRLCHRRAGKGLRRGLGWSQ